MYKLGQILSPQTTQSMVIRLEDNAFIPFDNANSDYQQYLKFLEEGGQPLPAEENE